jgi:hypothetical protein
VGAPPEDGTYVVTAVSVVGDGVSPHSFGFLCGKRFYRLVEINRQIKEPRHFNAGALLFGMLAEDETYLQNRFASYLVCAYSKAVAVRTSL